MIHKHILEGCSPTPLAHYLKALGILRLVSEQKDEKCRGAWKDDHFVLATTLTREELEKFFLEEYSPTAFVAPWSKGSGFYQKNDPGIMPVETSTAKRFASYREGIKAARGLFVEMEVADAKVREIKGEAKSIKNSGAKKIFEMSEDYKSRLTAADHVFKELKIDLFPNCRLLWRSTHQQWMASAVVLDEVGKPKYPSLFGTGGNDGRLDFTNNFMQRLGELFELDQPDGTGLDSSIPLLKGALWADIANHLFKGAAIGQYLPGSAGGANSTTGTDGDSLVNPWDFVLMLEGAVQFSSTATKRLNPHATIQASAPFALYNQALGSGSISAEEESPRGEQWMPLWDRFLSHGELKSLLAEGRAQIGRSLVSRPVDMARAIALLGVSRGITGFQRYGYLVRNGLSNFAIPLDRINVKERPRARLIEEIAPWMDRLHREARDKAPTRLIQAEKILVDAVFAVLTHDESPELWQAILLAAVQIENIQARGTGIKCGPIPRLSPDWIFASLGIMPGPKDRLAVALGSAAASYSPNGRGIDGIRHHWLPLNQYENGFATKDGRLVHDVRMVAQGRSPEPDLLAVFDRRSIESAKTAERHPQLVAAKGAEASLADVAAWISGAVDVESCVNLARAFMAVDWRQWVREGFRVPSTGSKDLPEDAWCAIKLNALPRALDQERDIPFDPAILRRLESGDGREALRLALRRLQAHGIRTALSESLCDGEFARRLGSALVFPISFQSSLQLLDRIQPNTQESRHVR